MGRTRIKICGVTRVEDAFAAAEMGADAVGIVHHPSSPRHVDQVRMAEIAMSLPPFVDAVLVIVDLPTSHAKALADARGIRWVQAHGDQEPGDVSELIPLSVIKVLRVGEANFQHELNAWRIARPANLAAILLDAPNQMGGSGVENDWPSIARHRDAGAFDGLRLHLAGGLTPDNVAGVIRRLRPWAVDVSSGVEQSKGVKSRELLRRFVEAVREADAA